VFGRARLGGLTQMYSVRRACRRRVTEWQTCAKTRLTAAAYPRRERWDAWNARPGWCVRWDIGKLDPAAGGRSVRVPIRPGLSASSARLMSRAVALGGGKQRALLAVLLLHPNEPPTTDRLIDEPWVERAPPTAAKALHVHVSRPRKALAPAAINGSTGESLA